MDILAYTSYEDVRAALGVTEEEVGDEVLALSVYANGLETELEDVNPNLVSELGTVLAIAESSRTVLQNRLVRMAHLFSTYAVAKQAGISLPLFAPQEITDSKSTMQRFYSPFKDVLKKVDEEFAKYKGKLDEVISVVLSSDANSLTPLVHFSVAGQSVNRITGES